MLYDRKALKLEARSLVSTTRPKTWVATLVFMLLAFALPQLVGGLFDPMWDLLPRLYDGMADMIASGEEPDALWSISILGGMVGSGMLSLFLSVLFSLLTMVLTYGYKGYALRVFLRQRSGAGDVFSAFPLAGRAIGTEILSGIFIFLWMLPIQLVGGAIVALSAGILGHGLGLEWLATVIAVLAWIVMLVLDALVAIRYSLAPFFVMSEGMGVLESITASKETMRGHYGKRLVLSLSFLSWKLLAVLIVYIVAVVGFAAVLFTVGMPWLMELEEASHYIMTEWESAIFILRSTADLLRDITLPMLGVAALAWLAALPLNLWLRAYETVAQAGFFLTVTGKVRLVDDTLPLDPPAAPAVPPISPVSEIPQAPQVPEVPSAPQAPEIPVAPEVPEAPAAPADPEE